MKPVPFTMLVKSDWHAVNDGPPKAGPMTAAICGTRPESLKCSAKRVPIPAAAAPKVSCTRAARNRSYSHAASARPADDPQILQIAGRVRAHAWAAGATAAHAARAVERAAHAQARGAGDSLAVLAEAEIEVWQAQTVASQLVIDAAASVFDALGASATLRQAGLDRHWRNARTVASHNPRIYKDRIVGDFAVNGTLPPGQWRIGTPDS
ncbi:hypothetical protein [Caballeronia sp. LZ043]|uniref:hypothetical protein n=1 Tax=Caballeronia sp. LZ043 TaxID=3038569 RepID=UPI00285E8AF6|nr:hypothetical protein [Caballeronia sp. LZ043]MDR5823572.1 hypothetical protein [Caballeronia sp. LZ043]